MTHDGLISAAISRGIVSPAQAVDLRRLAAELAGGEESLRAPSAAAEPAPRSEDEALRLVTGFADIFVTLGLALFLGAFSYFVGQIAGSSAASWAAVAAVSWLLAEFFTRRRRMALPSIALLAAFTLAAFGALLHGLALARGEDAALPDPWSVPAFAELHPLLAAAAALLTCAAAALHYYWFRVPITIAAGAVALAGAIFAALFAAAPVVVGSHAELVILVLGLAVFALAMHFDMADRARLTRRTDVAFWLHLAAAPMIVHPLFAGLGGSLNGVEPGRAGLILAAFLLLGLVAVAIDRRAMLVSGLIYAGIACGTLLQNVGGTAADQIVPATLLTLGIFILALSAGWHPLRRRLLRLLPARLTHRLPDPVTAS